MMSIRLKGIVQDVDFRYNELSIYEKFRKSKSFVADPRVGEAILFVSKNGNQLLWVLGYDEDVMVQKTSRRRIETLRLRVSGGYWNPLMLADYAENVGIQLEGLKKFEEVYEASRAKKNNR